MRMARNKAPRQTKASRKEIRSRWLIWRVISLTATSANRPHGVEMLRAETQGSISISEVPATGTVRSRARNETAAKHSSVRGKQRRARRHAANSVAQMVATYRNSMTVIRDRCEARTRTATIGANRENRKWAVVKPVQ